MLIKIYFFITIIIVPLYSIRLPRSALWKPIPESDKEKDSHNKAWSNWNDGHDSGYLFEKGENHAKDSSNYKHAIKEESEEHALKSAAGAGKHLAAAAEKGVTKHVDQARTHGKDVKANTFGFFDYHYKQPEYRVEQFFTDEKHRQKSGTDRLHHSSKDHESDKHKSSGWGKHGKGYHNDATGLQAHEHGEKFHNGWANNFQKSHKHEGEKDYSKGHQAQKGHYHHEFVPEPHPPAYQPHHYDHDHHEHHDQYDEDHDGWVAAPHKHHGYGPSLWDSPTDWDKYYHDWDHKLD